MAVRPIDGTWSKFVWNLSKSESLARKFRDGKACLIDLRLAVEAQPTLTPPNEPLISGFDVIDTKTGEYPDLWKIALKEDWANGLMYCDMEGFAIEEDGTLLLLDECGKHAYCPEGRFKIVPRPPEGEEGDVNRG